MLEDSQAARKSASCWRLDRDSRRSCRHNTYSTTSLSSNLRKAGRILADYIRQYLKRKHPNDATHCHHSGLPPFTSTTFRDKDKLTFHAPSTQNPVLVIVNIEPCYWYTRLSRSSYNSKIGAVPPQDSINPGSHIQRARLSFLLCA